MPPEKCKWFFEWLSDASADFRVSKSFLSGVRYVAFGLGNSLYGDNFNKVRETVPSLKNYCANELILKVVKELDENLTVLEAKRVIPLCLADENVVESKNGGRAKFLLLSL